MANPWCRLWADMPNDPKWRTIARASKQSIGNVVAVYVHMMVCASNATERGRTEGWSDEDIATALDMETEQVTVIRESMQGRVLDGDRLVGKYVPSTPSTLFRPSPSVWSAIRSRIFDRDDYTCRYCDKRGGRLECDHVHPVAKGGSHNDENLVTACFSCNRSKRDKTVDEWGGPNDH